MSHHCHRSVLLATALLLVVSWSCTGPGNTPETTIERFFEGHYAAGEKLIDPELSPKDRAALLSWTRDDLLSPLAGGWSGGGRMYEVLPGDVAVTKMELTEIGVPRTSSRDRSQAAVFVRGKYSAAGRVTSHRAYQRLDGGGISLLDKRTDSVTFEDKPFSVQVSLVKRGAPWYIRQLTTKAKYVPESSK